MPPADFDPRDRATQCALRLIAEEAARAGGHVARRYFRTELAVRLKADRSEVCEADEAAQAAVIALIQAHRPADAFIAEEVISPPSDLLASSPRPTNDTVCWAIDPLDGTRNFVRGIPLYACSVAALFGGTPLVGAIYDPQRDVLYSASRAEGLLVDHTPRAARPPVRVGPLAHRPRPLVAIPSTPSGPATALVHAWLGRIVCRNFGSTALHLAMVATGELDALLADNARLWDLAAGWVLVTAAGGEVTSPIGAPLFPLDVQTYADDELPTLAAATELHRELLSLPGA